MKASGQETFLPEPWLVLELDSSGLKMVRTGGDLWFVDYILVPADKELTSFDHLRWVRDETPEPTQDARHLEMRHVRPRRALYVSLGMFAAGLTMGFVALANWESCFLVILGECPEYPDWVTPVGWTGFLFAVVGLIGTTASAAVLGRRRGRASHRAHWDLARSRLVF